ncbi:MAG: hypothetical protein Q4A21_00260 [bacterium]|nr:hypothetical protein [bacterium]
MKEKIIRLAPILLIIAIAIFSIALIVSLGRMMFGGDGEQTQQETSTEVKDESVEQLLKNEEGRSVKMTVRGPITAREDSKYYTVDVSNSARSLKTYKGYQFTDVIDKLDLPNDAKAYDEFIFALNKANMMKGKQFVGEADDLRGVCATGHVYDFAILKDGEVKKHLWTSTCEGAKGSLAANKDQLQNLFISQIPNNAQIVKDLGVEKKRGGVFGL